MLNISYNSPVILTFSILSFILFFTNNFLGGIFDSILVLNPYFNIANPLNYLSLFTYTLGHASLQHLFGNLSLLLVVGPIIEEKYGSKKLATMMALTAFTTALLQIFFFNNGLLGASGIVFMLILLASFTNTSDGKIPLTFILVLTFYIGNELSSSFNNDNVSHFAHIIGGLLGGLFGYISTKNHPIK